MWCSLLKMAIRGWVYIFNRHDTEVSLSILKKLFPEILVTKFIKFGLIYFTIEVTNCRNSKTIVTEQCSTTCPYMEKPFFVLIWIVSMWLLTN